MNSEKVIHVGIATRDFIRQRTIDIAAGKIKPESGEPKIWVTSPKVIAQVLSQENINLVQVIKKLRPSSVSSLAVAVGRSQSNVSRTLKRLAELGIVDLVKENNSARPIVVADRMQLDVDFVD